MGKCTEPMRRKRKCHNCGETEMEKDKNQDGKKRQTKAEKAFFFLESQTRATTS